MPPVSDWATTAGGNTTTLGINIAEGCPAANINGAIRELLAQAKTKFDLTDTTIAALDTLGTALLALDALTPAANKLPYFTSSSAATLTDISSFARTILDDTDAATVCTTIGAIRVSAAVLTNSGYIKFITSLGTFTIQWGSVSASANSTTAVTYPTAYTSWSKCFNNGGLQAGNAQDNNPFVVGGSGTTTGATIYSSLDSSATCDWVSFGV